MGKIDVQKVVAEMQKLYQKDKRVTSIIGTGADVRAAYTEADVIPLPAGNPLRVLSGLPGIPFNKIVQVAGKADSGKSTLAAESMVSAQKSGAQVILWDSEDKFDAARFKKMGGDPTAVLLIKTNEILKGGELARRYINTVKEQVQDAKIFFVWDSVGGSQSRSHAERELDDEKHAQPGQDAKENGSVMKTLVSLINKHPNSIAVYLANQTYAKIGFMAHGDAASGGAKIEYHSSLIVFLKQIKHLEKVSKGVKYKYGIVSRATAKKNHLSQSEMSVHQLDFVVTASGTELTDAYETEKDE